MATHLICGNTWPKTKYILQRVLYLIASKPSSPKDLLLTVVFLMLTRFIKRGGLSSRIRTMSYRPEKQGLLFLDKVDPFGIVHTAFCGCGLFRVTKTLFLGRGAAVGFSKCYSIKWKKRLC